MSGGWLLGAVPRPGPCASGPPGPYEDRPSARIGSVRAMPEPAALLAGLDPEQLAAVTSAAAPLAVLAGAGSGKTRVLTRRIAWRIHTDSAEPGHVLAVTFTRKAARELTHRLRALGVADRVVAGTFHSIALAQLRRFADDHDRPPPRLLDRKARLIAPLLADRASPDDRSSPNDIARVAGVAAREIEWAKARGVPVERYEAAALAAHRRPGVPLARLGEIYGGYERERRRKRLLDFDDLILGCTDLMRRDHEFAAAQRWRFRHLHVDEFQDASPAQLRLVQAWLGGRADLFAVGDPDQAIYSFAGAEPDSLERFCDHFPGAEVIELRTNHRSSAPIIAAARAVLGPLTRDEPRRPDRARTAPLPTFVEFETGADEARGVADSVKRMTRAGAPPSSIAILARTNTQAAAFARALHEVGVAHRVRAASTFLADAAVTANLDALEEIERTAPGRPFAAHLHDLSAALDPAPRAEPTASRAELDALLEMAREYADADAKAATVAGFRAYLSAALRRDNEPVGRDGVEVVTFHRAKGLEWDTVFVAGMEEGFVPISYATTTKAVAEERRLAYVALSRARRELHLSWARRRDFGGREAQRQPSPWIGDVVDAIADQVPEVAVGAAERVAALRASLDRPAVTDAITAPLASAATAAVAERRRALTRWRTGRATANGVPESVVMRDALLAALAAAAPGSRAELRAAGCPEELVERHGAELLDVLLRAPAGAR